MSGHTQPGGALPGDYKQRTSVLLVTDCHR